MEAWFTIIYHEKVVSDDIPKLSEDLKERVRHAVETKLVLAPATFGKPLRRALKGYRKLRVGDYRVIFRVEGNIVKIFIIQHRRHVYEHVLKRLR